jgi:hypothetical protein
MGRCKMAQTNYKNHYELMEISFKGKIKYELKKTIGFNPESQAAR